jgi:hypothetical protein
VLLKDAERLQSSKSLAEITQLFFENRIPVCCVATPEVARETKTENTEILAGLAAIHADEPGLFEVALSVSGVDETERFFQTRSATELRNSLRNGDSSSVETQLANSVSTIELDAGVKDFDISAYRGAGFRVFLHPDYANSQHHTDAERVGRDQLLLSGRLRLEADPEAVAQLDALFANGVSSGGYVLELSLADWEKADRADGWTKMRELADGLKSLINRGAVIVSRPVDLLLQSGEGIAANIAIMLEGAPTESLPHVSVFADELIKLSVPVNWSGQVPYSDRVDITLEEGAGPHFELTDSVRYAVPVEPLTEELALQAMTDPLRDQVVRIPSDLLNTFVARARLVNQLAGLKQSGRARFHTLGGLVDHLFAPDAILAKFTSARRRRETFESDSLVLPEAERVRLATDARIAWGFLNTYTHSVTGLCAGTVRDGPDVRINRNATLWDVASQMFGISAALSIGIIPKDEARERLDVLLNNLPSIRIGGARLPPAVFSTATKRAAEQGFDACDTGRFLNALDAMVQTGLVTEARAKTVLDQWDLSEAAHDGALRNFFRGRWVDSSQSFCTPYVKEAFGKIGVQVDALFAEEKGVKSASDLIRSMYRAVRVGQISAEPLLLPAVEGAHVPVFDDLSAVLFDAQLRWYEETGTFKCVSETLLDFEPWFSYQGLFLDKEGADAWGVASPVDQRKYDTPEFAEKAEVISSKAAYLWLATFPHSHSAQLVSFVRDKARYEDFGFAAGVFAKSLEPMERYSDVNTNGIILTAIAHILR